MKESDFQYAELLKALKDYDAKGVVICESPNLEEDALLLQATYNTYWKQTGINLPLIQLAKQLFDLDRLRVPCYTLATRGVAQLASAQRLGRWGRRFESSHPDH